MCGVCLNPSQSHGFHRRCDGDLQGKLFTKNLISSSPLALQEEDGWSTLVRQSEDRKSIRSQVRTQAGMSNARLLEEDSWKFGLVSSFEFLYKIQCILPESPLYTLCSFDSRYFTGISSVHTMCVFLGRVDLMRQSSYPLLSSQKLYQIMSSKPQLLTHMKEALVCHLRLSLQCPLLVIVSCPLVWGAAQLVLRGWHSDMDAHFLSTLFVVSKHS